eukprot:COSAG02_NODE_6984_length_3248_cov_2.215624_3_plen_74_part_00
MLTGSDAVWVFACADRWHVVLRHYVGSDKSIADANVQLWGDMTVVRKLVFAQTKFGKLLANLDWNFWVIREVV